MSNAPEKGTQMKITIARPVDGRSETFHVHCAGCADLTKGRKYRTGDSYDLEAETLAEVAMDTYPPEDFDYDPETEVEMYMGDFKVFPCAGGLR